MHLLKFQEIDSMRTLIFNIKNHMRKILSSILLDKNLHLHLTILINCFKVTVNQNKNFPKIH